MSHKNPQISIVIPCYNEARFIKRTLQSLHAQEFDGTYEVIVVDNNCTDDTVTIAKTLGARIISEGHPGICWAREAGTNAAHGAIVISTDADTTFSKSWLQTIYDTFQANPSCVAVAGPCTYSDGPWWGKPFSKLLFDFVSGYYHLTGRPCYVTATNIAFKKAAWDHYDTTFTQAGDEVALLHALRKKGKVVFDNGNPVFTSGRRLSKGLLYNLFVTVIFYYFLAYYISKFIGRPIVGTYPAFRSKRHRPRTGGGWYQVLLVTCLATVVWLPLHSSIDRYTDDTIDAAGNFIRRDLI